MKLLALQTQMMLAQMHTDALETYGNYLDGHILRQISVYDTINKKGKYSQKVRRLGEFHPRLRELAGSDGQDIDDPLYGNDGGSLETVSLLQQHSFLHLTLEFMHIT